MPGMISRSGNCIAAVGMIARVDEWLKYAKQKGG
jgi:hypothetical protein